MTFLFKFMNGALVVTVILLEIGFTIFILSLLWSFFAGWLGLAFLLIVIGGIISALLS